MLLRGVSRGVFPVDDPAAAAGAAAAGVEVLAWTAAAAAATTAAAAGSLGRVTPVLSVAAKGIGISGGLVGAAGGKRMGNEGKMVSDLMF